MANYKFKDIERALNYTNFYEVKNNAGSHQVYKNFEIGLSQPVPKHAKDEVKSGTAESILDYVILAARIQNINIAGYKYNISDNVREYIVKRHAEIKKNKLALIPADIRKQRHIETLEEGQAYLDELATSHKQYVKNTEKSF